MNCPNCNERLRQTERMGVTADVCPNCRGAWLEAREMERLLDGAERMGMRPDRHDYRSGQYDQGRGIRRPHDSDSDDGYGHGGRHSPRQRGLLARIFRMFD